MRYQIQSKDDDGEDSVWLPLYGGNMRRPPKEFYRTFWGAWWQAGRLMRHQANPKILTNEYLLRVRRVYP